jgi:CHASE2 domain-containing sensor protein
MANGERSIIPMIMGIVGGVTGLPSSVCGGACAAGFTAATGKADAAAQSAGNVFLALGVVGALLGLVFGFMGRKMPVLAGLGMLAGAGFSGICLVTMNLLALIPTICFLIGAIFALLNRNKPVSGVVSN